MSSMWVVMMQSTSFPRISSLISNGLSVDEVVVIVSFSSPVESSVFLITDASWEVLPEAFPGLNFLQICGSMIPCVKPQLRKVSANFIPKALGAPFNPQSALTKSKASVW